MRAASTTRLAKRGLQEFLKEAPLSEKAKQDFQRLLTRAKRLFSRPQLRRKEGAAGSHQLCKVSDRHGRRERRNREIVPGASRTRLFGVGIDAVSAQDAWGLEMPGFNGLKLDPAPGKGMNRDCHPQRRSGEILLSLSRRQRVDRPAAGAQADSVGNSGELRHRRGAGQGRLLEAR